MPPSGTFRYDELFTIEWSARSLVLRQLQPQSHTSGRTRTVQAHFDFSFSSSPCLNDFVDDEPIQLPIDGVLDLHAFQPREVKSLVLAYLVECRVRGVLRVRIIHGKGIGQLRETVHKLLEKNPDVVELHLASEHFGGWGATIVHLQPPHPNP